MRFPILLALVSLALVPACKKADPDWPAPQPSGEPGAVKVAHVLIGFPDAVGFRDRGFNGKDPKRTRAQAEELAQKTLARAQAGEDFDALIKELSDDAGDGVYVLVNEGVPKIDGSYARGGMATAFGDVGFALRVGEIGMTKYHRDKSQFGWHIIKRLR